METATYILEQYHSGKTVHFGEGAWLSQGCLFITGEQVELNTIVPLYLDAKGHIVIERIGAREPWLVVPTAALDNVEVMLEVVNRLVNEVPYVKRRSVTGWPPGSVGDLSARIGYDWRELKMAGYSDSEIQGVLSGDRTLDELLRSKPGQS